jgi:hypothetical protein
MATSKRKGAEPEKALYVYSSNVRSGQLEAFQKWVGQNKRLTAAQPNAWTLKGVYLTAFGFGSVDVEVHWEIEGYGALDLARSTAEKRGEFFDFLTQFHSFLEPATGTGRLLKSATSNQALIVGC